MPLPLFRAMPRYDTPCCLIFVVAYLLPRYLLPLRRRLLAGSSLFERQRCRAAATSFIYYAAFHADATRHDALPHAAVFICFFAGQLHAFTFAAPSRATLSS